MFVLVDEQGRVSLQARDEFRAFELRAPTGATSESLARALVGVAELDGDGFAWVHEDWLAEQLLRQPPTPDWRPSFDAMRRFAQGKGWVRPDPSRIRAHVVRAF